MTYAVRLLYPTQGEPPPTKQLDGTFGSLREAWDAGSAEVLNCQLRSVEAGFQILDADGRIVEVTEGQVDD